MKGRTIYIVLVTFNAAILVAILLWGLSRPPDGNSFKARFIPTHADGFDLRRHFPADAKQLDTTVFPVRAFLDSADISTAGHIAEHLRTLDSLFPNRNQNREVLFSVLSWKMAALYFNHPIEHADTLLGIFLWSQQFHYAQSYIKDSDFFYQSLCDFWTNQVAEDLSLLSERHPSTRYSFEYRYLVQRCAELDYYIPIHVLNYEKVTSNLLESNWGHLLNASYSQSSRGQKIFFVVCFLVFVYGCYQLIYKIFQIRKKLRYEDVHY